MKVKTKSGYVRRGAVFRTLALDVGKPSSSPELNHVSRWLTQVSPASPANAPANRLLPHPGKGRYLQSFSLHPQQKQNTLLSSCASAKWSVSSLALAQCAVTLGKPLTCPEPTEHLTFVFPADRRAWVQLICWGAKSTHKAGQKQRHCRAEETLTGCLESAWGSAVSCQSREKASGRKS